MPSQSFTEWSSVRVKKLDQIEAAHATVGGHGPGRRYATEQINHAYAVLLSAQFQGYCRDLHSESADYLSQNVGSPLLQDMMHESMIQNRKLDRGNPNPSNIGADFGRFAMAFWYQVQNLDHRNLKRQNRLEELSLWRNAIAHQDFNRLGSQSKSLKLSRVRAWRKACEHLAQSFDEVMCNQIQCATNARPW